MPNIPSYRPRDEKPLSLMAKTQALLKASKISYPQIFLDTSIEITWLSRFANGGTPNPSVNRVQKLYEYLTGKRLQV